jgi:hypothetical protein
MVMTVDGPDVAPEAARHATHSDVPEKVKGAVGGLALEGTESLLNAVGVRFEREIGCREPSPTLIGISERHAGATGTGGLARRFARVSLASHPVSLESARLDQPPQRDGALVRAGSG